MLDSDGAQPRRGRLHGRMLQILGLVSVIAGLIALWQFGVFGDEPDRDPVAAVDGLETPAISGAAEESSAETTPTLSATASPSESTAPETSAAPPSESASPQAPPSTTAAEPEEPAEPTACSASLELTKTWDDMVEVSVEVVNTGTEAIGSWEIDLDLDDAKIEHYWNMRHLQADQYGNEDWNGRLDPDENAVLGFQAEVGRHFELPASVDCTARV